MMTSILKFRMADKQSSPSQKPWWKIYHLWYKIILSTQNNVCVLSQGFPLPPFRRAVLYSLSFRRSSIASFGLKGLKLFGCKISNSKRRILASNTPCRDILCKFSNFSGHSRKSSRQLVFRSQIFDLLSTGSDFSFRRKGL